TLCDEAASDKLAGASARAASAEGTSASPASTTKGEVRTEISSRGLQTSFVVDRLLPSFASAQTCFDAFSICVHSDRERPGRRVRRTGSREWRVRRGVSRVSAAGRQPVVAIPPEVATGPAGAELIGVATGDAVVVTLPVSGYENVARLVIGGLA